MKARGRGDVDVQTSALYVIKDQGPVVCVEEYLAGGHKQHHCPCATHAGRS